MNQIERNAYTDLTATAFAAKQYNEALEYSQHALALASQKDGPQDWARLQALVGVCHQELGARFESGTTNTHL